MRIVSVIAMIIVALYISGCGTYSSLEYRNNHDPVVFSGVRTDVKSITFGADSNEWLEQRMFYNPYLDLPFSAISDVIILPYTIGYAITHWW